MHVNQPRSNRQLLEHKHVVVVKLDLRSHDYTISAFVGKLTFIPNGHVVGHINSLQTFFLCVYIPTAYTTICGGYIHVCLGQSNLALKFGNFSWFLNNVTTCVFNTTCLRNQTYMHVHVTFIIPFLWNRSPSVQSLKHFTSSTSLKSYSFFFILYFCRTVAPF